MTARRSGAILTLSTAGSRFARPGNLGYGTTCAAIETMSSGSRSARPSGVRSSACADRDRPPASNGSYTGELFGRFAAAAGISVEQMLARWREDQTLLGRLPTLAQVAEAAVFLASDGAGAITGTVADLTCGNAVRTNLDRRWSVCSTRKTPGRS